ncbi:LysM-like peptidoglycan-binding domain-containing protein [Proteus faecis]|uniref:LysM-like peptidoglycan-binding domain-containing protein n=2 Tax=Proteus faecis TaxID=2050967 RepID=A0AAW7CTL3_9GAMM|nr:LysM-like peptidoglycan-binding domain-containing protein [Proteus faecis]MBG3012381.1 cell envelope opacity-associated protein A [Proteus mirabilis]MDL5167147.1 LysM-like peptidoglycan-binding domain-containing protein [Proteus faecis]MDL5275199.1 LysM-like peptidoglycan-binding domain-containing protein [Proteus faecis]MDL5278768.1 LysM-like peptidoglycan-binding domain-containing protein [Proteus faecis]MDL5307770.1 LysM-like peptidoglycan-binding domain-containing protein [Proteus faeci
MVRASMATRNKKDVTAIHNTDSQINNEVNMGKFPGLHRRAILVIAIVLLVVFFWPTSENNGEPPQPSSSTHDLPVPIASTNDPVYQTPIPQAQESLNADPEVSPSIDNPTTENAPVGNVAQATPPQDTQSTPEQKTWQTYTIKEGQTLAQLFRDNQLPVNDAFSMAKSEDQQKSLSQLRSGQTIRLQRNPQGDVSMLEVTNSAGTVITYTRLSDGSYYRTP